MSASRYEMAYSTSELGSTAQGYRPFRKLRVPGALAVFVALAFGGQAAFAATPASFHRGTDGGGASTGDIWVANVGSPEGLQGDQQPHLACTDIDVWGNQLSVGKGLLTVYAEHPRGTGKPATASTWSYGRGAGGPQVTSVINVHTLIAAAVPERDGGLDTHGFHFTLKFSEHSQRTKTFWVDCPQGHHSPGSTPTTTVVPKPTPTCTATLTVAPASTPAPAPTATATPTAIPAPTPTPTPTATAKATATPTVTPTATALPTATPSPSPTGAVQAVTPTPTPAPAGDKLGASTATPNTGAHAQLRFAAILLMFGMALLALARRRADVPTTGSPFLDRLLREDAKAVRR